MPVGLILTILVPPLVEQLGKTCRLYLRQRRAAELEGLRQRVEALEALVRWR